MNGYGKYWNLTPLRPVLVGIKCYRCRSVLNLSFFVQLSSEERKKESAWFDVGIIKGTSCTVSSYYLPNGDLEKTEIDVEVREDIYLIREMLKV